MHETTPLLEIAEIDREIREGRQHLGVDLYFGSVRLVASLILANAALLFAPRWAVVATLAVAAVLALLALGHYLLCVGYLIGLRWYRRKRREAVAWICHGSVREV